ncbi:DUF3226 domain-containing protein [Flavobacterium lipolyticum]|uniref:DUF4276 family protein n=1 Tax=Flavobacterium lipolyticum TaxID=2893754 RepID=A0ABS8LZF6_9FLAO|nr:DUF3226 domain-containing protein [Flavobacterium sp. F-126]MCC9017969.1 hypothetical protein [Flavobacterium sp. F-126]
MIDVVLLVEDKNDVSFFRDFILKNYCDSDIKKQKYVTEKEYEITVGNKKIVVADTNKGSTETENTGGWAKLKNQINSNFFIKLKAENENIKFISLFDADEDKSDNISKKEKDIQDWLNGKKTTINRFYLPFNNNESHNLEQLLELSFNKNITPCWDDFISCIVNDRNADATIPSSKKGKIIVYKDLYSSIRNKNNEYLSEMWNLDTTTNEHLKPLKGFLDQFLK